MSVEFCRESPGKFDSRTLSRETLSRWTGRNCVLTQLSCTDLLSTLFVCGNPGSRGVPGWYLKAGYFKHMIYDVYIYIYIYVYV